MSTGANEAWQRAGLQRVGPGLLNCNKPISLSFNGKRYPALQGDTLASALLANGQTLVGRSFKYHRPRGVFSAGSEEPNALVELRSGAYLEPNTRATIIEAFDGLVARSQNHRGPLRFDVMAINDYLSPFLSAGFYYKTFMWPKAFWEKLYEPVIRSAAGLGSLSTLEDPDCYDKGFLHTDLLVIGAGPAGLSAALTAARSGQRVMLADEDFLMGGRLNLDQCVVDNKTGAQWAADVLVELQSMDNVQLLPRTTVYGAFDHGIYGALERKTDHLPTLHSQTLNQERTQSSAKPRQIHWRIYAKQTLLCTGATERSIVFPDNDRPGIMLAGAVRAYLNRYGVTPGKRTVVFTNNDDAWRTAQDLQAAGAWIVAVIDTRAIKAPLEIPGARLFMGNSITKTSGRLSLQSVTLSSGVVLACDCLAVSGGWNPTLHLTCHQRGRPVWNDALVAFLPGADLPQGMQVAGAANGDMSLASALAAGHQAALNTLQHSGIAVSTSASTGPIASAESCQISAFWQVPDTKGRAWIDLQNDVTSKDLALSYQDGFHAVEHAKRYTTLGMATDQGKTSNVLGIAVMATLKNQSIAETGTTIFRPPYTPVSLGAMAGRARGKHFRPTRLTPGHDWAAAQGASFVESGAWLRAEWFTRAGEYHWRDTVNREVLGTRSSVGICDVTTLGKIDIQGADAGEFLDKVYANMFSTLAVGKVRYGLMLREDGFVMDDGTTARLADNHYVMTTTTANAVGVFRHMEFARQCLWPQLDVHLISATEQWAQYAIAGPNSRHLLEHIVDSPFDISNEAFPFMACASLSVCGGTPARLFRISFSGELAYELAVPARYGHSLADALMQAGKPYQVMPYGIEALGVMRIEKGHAAGNELTGQTTAANLGLDMMLSRKKDHIGSTLAKRPAMNGDDKLELMGFMPTEPSAELKAGAHFLNREAAATLGNDLGWMSSVAYSPSLNSFIGLGFIRGGKQRINDVVIAADPLRNNSTAVRIVSPHFIDPEGARLRE